MKRFVIFFCFLVLANSLFANGAMQLTSKERAEGRGYESEFSKFTHKFSPLNEVINSVKVKIVDGKFTCPEYYISEILVTKDNSDSNPTLAYDVDSLMMPSAYVHHSNKLRQYWSGAKGNDVYLIYYMISPIQKG
jgi:hypothetical protein